MERDKKKAKPLIRLETIEQDKIIREKLAGIKRKILVMSGKGGVGKSTVAAYLALLLSEKGYRVGLLDADLHGPSIPHLLRMKGGLEFTEDGKVKPYRFSDHLGVVSVELALGDKDTAIIWRGPLKIRAIKQFISDIEWGEMDYLIIDSPPGTGDEPLTVAQTIPDAEALIITTPQEISLADVRKSIRFCQQVRMNVIGVVENMSGLLCPHCRKKIFIFGEGGGARMAKEMNIPLLAEIPIDPEMVRLGDKGLLAELLPQKDLEMNKAYQRLLRKIEA